MDLKGDLVEHLVLLHLQLVEQLQLLVATVFILLHLEQHLLLLVVPATLK
jgi:hypothetical protein